MRHIAVLCALALCAGCLCACGKTGSGLSPAGMGKTEDVQPVTFSLPSLPEIGSYRQKRPTYFYGAPLDQFVPSGDYGTVVPYCLASNGEVGSYGFMTADGKIITDAVYSSVYLLEGDGRSVYAAQEKVFSFEGEQEEEEYDGLYAPSVDRNMTLLIAADGSKSVKLPGMSPQTGYDDSMFIECRIPQKDGGFVGDTFYLYDFDLNLAVDLTEYGIVNGSVTADSADRFVVADWEKAIYFEDGVPVKTVPVAYGSTILPNGMSYDNSNLYDAQGEAVFPLSGITRCLYEERIGALLIAEVEIGRVTKWIDAEEAARFQASNGWFSDVSVCYPDGECRIILSLNEDWDETTGCLVLDGDLNLLTTIDGSGASLVRQVTDERGDGSFCCFLLGYGDRTDICDLSGETVATLPFAYDGWPDVLAGSVFFADDTGATYRFSVADRSLTECVSAVPGREVRSVSFVNDRVLICMYHHVNTGRYSDRDVTTSAEEDFYPIALEEDHENDYRYILTDPATGETLYDNVTDLEITELGERTWISFSVNGTAYVYDGEMNLITAFADDYYA